MPKQTTIKTCYEIDNGPGAQIEGGDIHIRINEALTVFNNCNYKTIEISVHISFKEGAGPTNTPESDVIFILTCPFIDHKNSAIILGNIEEFCRLNDCDTEDVDPLYLDIIIEKKEIPNLYTLILNKII